MSTPEEREGIRALRGSVSQAPHAKHPSFVDWTPECGSRVARMSANDLRRFLRAREGDVDKATDMVWQWAVWRGQKLPGSEFTPETVLDNPVDKNEHVYARLMPHANHGLARDGQPVYWEKTGEISGRFGEIVKELSPDELVVRHVRQQELMIHRLKYSTQLRKQRHGSNSDNDSGNDRASGNGNGDEQEAGPLEEEDDDALVDLDEHEVEKQVIVFDLSSLSYSLQTTALNTFKRTLEIDQNYYPERLCKLLFINTPWVFQPLWAMIKPWVAPHTVAKFHLLGGDYHDSLKDHIEPHAIPVEYGGHNNDIVWGWSYDHTCSLVVPQS